MTINKVKHTTLSDSTSDIAIEIKGVSKNLRRRQVLKNVNLTVPIGTITGISGPNGSGKSMLLRVISGLVLPDSGTVRVFDQTIGRDNEFPNDLGAVIDGPGFALGMSGSRNLELLASIRHQITTRDVRKAIEAVGLDPDDRRPVKAYSTGMRQRLGIAQAIMENPRLLLLDEPTSALDAEGVITIHNLLQNLQHRGCTIIIVSHNKNEIEKLCAQIYQMDAGVLQGGASNSLPN